MTSAASTPVQCTGVPTCGCSSKTVTDQPLAARPRAAARPPGPPPTIATSSMRGRLYRPPDGIALDLSIAIFPTSARGDPERLHDQPQVETEANLFLIQQVVAKLAGTRQIARCVHLRDAGEARTHSMTRFVSRDRTERQHDALGGSVGLTRAQGSRTDHAHVAAKDVPQLWQLVERGGAKHAAHLRHARIVFRGLHRAGQPLGIDDHRSELNGGEHTAITAHSLLGEQYRAAVLNRDAQRNERGKWR